MGTFHSKGDKIKRDKNHNRQKMFKFGISFGRNEGHLQMGYNSKTIKNYGPLDKQLVSKENLSSTMTGTEDRLITPESEAITTED